MPPMQMKHTSREPPTMNLERDRIIKLVIDASQLHATLLIHIPQRNILWHQQVNQVNQEKLHYSPEMVELD